MIAAIALSFGLLALSLKSVPFGTAYAVWTGIGAVGTVIIGMAAFGLGTLPWLLAAGAAASRLRAWLSARAFRLAAGGLVLGFGVWGIARAAALPEAIRATFLCL